MMKSQTQKSAAATDGRWQSIHATTVQLTLKEQEVLYWAALGKSAWEISRIQGRTEAAVNYHLCNIRRKFGVSSLKAALVKAIDQGVIVLH
jgi:LuxR family quorum-sensing transcriptional regulator LasR